jgi:dephospho-CoA kinase
MTEAKFESILKRQTPDNEKRHGADFVVLTDKGLDFAREQVRKIIELVRAGRTSSDTVSG